jgi:hypothetical protein
MTLTHYIIAIVFLLLFIVCLVVAVADAMRDKTLVEELFWRP